MISGIKTVFIIIILSSAFLSCSSCSSGGSGDHSKPTVPPLLFGANYDWNYLAYYSVENGDLLRDRSFRSRADIVNKIQVWGTLEENGGLVTFNTTDPGDTNPAGNKSYTGYVELTWGSAGYTGILQQAITGIKAGQSYTVFFSSYGVGSTATLDVYLYDPSYTSSLDSSLSIPVADSAWTQHEITLTPSADEDAPIVAIYLRSTGSVRIDEVRMTGPGSEPGVKASLKTSIRDLGITSLRWPGGTLADWFFWKDSIGTIISRGEFQAYNHYETPALGLHEFLDLCEELNIEPVVQVNVLDTPENAADLVEYILGSASTTQGAARGANGRTGPWDVQYFEMGNEPSAEYSGGSLPDAGTNYASLANDVISQMKAKAGSLGKTIFVGAINEPSFQQAEWLIPGDNGILDLIYNWNSQVFDTQTGVKNADFTNGHFYSSRYYNADEEINFHYAMTGGKLMNDTISTDIEAETSLPFWLTEYNIFIEDGGGPIVSYLKDFQSGLAVADILMYVISSRKIHGAHVYNLLHGGGFGILLDPDTGALRPAGVVFKLFSAIAGEELLTINIDDTSTHTITAGEGNVPSGFTYPLVTALATKNSATGKPRVMLLNRDYSNDITVNIDLENFVPGTAELQRYENADLSANNESSEDVSISIESITINSPFEVTIPALSLWRIDFE
jgi:alpha-L-arabinofuranosidase